MEKEETEEKKKVIYLSRFEMLIQIIALLLLIALFIVDKIMNIISPPIDSYYYGFLLAVGFGLKKEIVALFGKKISK